jgi:hypothetical protein
VYPGRVDREALYTEIERAGCRIVSDGGDGFVLIDCPDDDAKIAVLDAAAWVDARYDGRIRRFALGILRGLPDAKRPTIARALHAFVRDSIRYVGEGIETFQSAWQTITLGFGDCDDVARLLLALARAVGIPARLEILRRDRDGRPKHATVKLNDGAGYQWAECTIAARFGEHPVAAMKRIGAASAGGRDDIGDASGLLFAANAVTAKREADARAVIASQWDPALAAATPAAFQGAQAIARHEGGGSSYGMGLAKRCPDVVNNWGAAQLPRSPTKECESLSGPRTIECPAGSGWCTDSYVDKLGKTHFYEVCFRSFATPEQGAAFYLRTLLGKGRESVAAVIGSGDADAIAAAMYSTRYFAGFSKNADPAKRAAENIADYAKAITAHAKIIADALGEPVMVARAGVVAPPSPSDAAEASVLSSSWVALPVGAMVLALGGWVAWKYGRGDVAAWKGAA